MRNTPSGLSEGEMEKIYTHLVLRGEYFYNNISTFELCGQITFISSDTRQMKIILQEARFDFLLLPCSLPFLGVPIPGQTWSI